MAVTTLTWAVPSPLIYGSCGCLPATTSTKKCKITSIGSAAATPDAVVWTSHPVYTGTTLAAIPVMTQTDGTDDNVTPACILGTVDEIETQEIEVSGKDYSTLLADVRVRFTGI